MPRAVLTVHLPEHRRRALARERDPVRAGQAYDRQAPAYFDFLRAEARREGLDLRTDPQEADVMLRIDECSHADKKHAHAWLETQPDIWNWLPSAADDGRPAGPASARTSSPTTDPDPLLERR